MIAVILDSDGYDVPVAGTEGRRFSTCTHIMPEWIWFSRYHDAVRPMAGCSSAPSAKTSALVHSVVLMSGAMTPARLPDGVPSSRSRSRWRALRDGAHAGAHAWKRRTSPARATESGSRSSQPSRDPELPVLIRSERGQERFRSRAASEQRGRKAGNGFGWRRCRDRRGVLPGPLEGQPALSIFRRLFEQLPS